jgi:hypothetical protein
MCLGKSHGERPETEAKANEARVLLFAVQESQQDNVLHS